MSHHDPELEALRKEVSRLQGVLDERRTDASSALGRVSDLEMQLAHANCAYDSVKARRTEETTQRDAEISRLQDQVSSIDADLTRERSAIDRWMDKATDFLGAYQDAAEVLQMVASERDELETQLQRAIALIKEGHAEIERLGGQVREMNGALTEAFTTRKALERELAEAQSKLGRNI